MSFNILVTNLKPHLWETNSDSIRFVRYALEECGVGVRLGVNQIDKSAINIFFDRFYDDPSLPTQLKAAGIKYGLVCTEAISADGIWNYGAEGDDPATFSAFELAARNAEFVWCQLEESVEACRAINPNSVHMPYGYVEKMETLTPTPANDRDIDFLMCGIPSPRRDALVKEMIESGGKVFYPAMPVPVYVRDGLMERSRINLSFQKTAAHKIISVTRICHSVINRVPLFLETEFPDNAYAKLCLTASSENPAKSALASLDATDLETWAEERYSDLVKNFPMKAFMEKVLNQTVSL